MTTFHPSHFTLHTSPFTLHTSHFLTHLLQEARVGCLGDALGEGVCQIRLQPALALGEGVGVEEAARVAGEVERAEAATVLAARDPVAHGALDLALADGAPRPDVHHVEGDRG